MEGAIFEMLKSAPTLAVLAYIVPYFLTHLKEVNEQNAKRQAEANEHCEARLEQHITQGRETNERLAGVIEDCTLVLGSVKDRLPK